MVGGAAVSVRNFPYYFPAPFCFLKIRERMKPAAHAASAPVREGRND